MLILGIETSCDETAASLLKIERGKFKVLKKVIASQISLHNQYGGIIPELAAREHIKKIIPVIEKALSVKPKLIDLIAVTEGPGLITSLLVGVETAKTLSLAWQKPLLGVNHLQGHLAANFLKETPSFPALGLIVSGGHTELILLQDYHHQKKIGQTRDDAAGECFDKIAKLLGLGYPGGPIVSQYAAQAKPNQIKTKLPRPMIQSKNYDFSFSGLKTAVLYTIQKRKAFLQNQKFIAEICYESQQAIIDVLLKKTFRAAQEFKVNSIILGGGVIANQELRKQFLIQAEKMSSSPKILIPPLEFCMDNATMIAVAAYFQYQKLNSLKKQNLKNNWRKIKANPNLEIEES
ncbi:tRNA (adenosine(37)-N6)-threonylcarbamoyltransferase complex transferase subunit TsaD [Patescibacteria group bacterium]|nr:tRNA (adenosine(37)-N6)-threonylcarbamoyltransferase complex transferase subunit TsaD [Patescibacteria group bacterium]